MNKWFIKRRNNIPYYNKILSYFIDIQIDNCQCNIPFHVVLSKNTLLLNSPNANQSNADLKLVFHHLFLQQSIYNNKYKNVLLLGLGLGSVIELLQEKCTISHITAVESSSFVIDLMHNYYFIENIEILNQSAETIQALTDKYDLIIIDVFEDNITPSFVANEDYLNRIKSMLSSNGILIWNTLTSTVKISEKIKTTFTTSEHIQEHNEFFIYRK